MKQFLGIFGFAAAAALVAGCGASPSGTALPGSAMAGANGSWVSPDAKNQTLIFVSSALTDQVYMYSYASGKLLGTLAGFTLPFGLCADEAGDVWVVDDGASKIDEYGHDGTPIATLTDSGEYPEGCAVDPVTGNLAVTNFSSNSGSGNVAIYTGAKGSPQTYSDPTIVNYRFCGFDSHGNLFVDGATASSTFVFTELPKGGHTFEDISLNHSIGWPGGVQWDGEHIAVGDTDASLVYRVDRKGVVKGVLSLGGSDYVNQFAIAKSSGKKGKSAEIVAPSQDNNAVRLYDYPAGGSPSSSIGVEEPFGVAVSPAK
jgi:DNA-binding beta-propeller fold protein YncE